MPRISRSVCRRVSYYPYEEWTEEKVWEDDEFEDIKHGTIKERSEKALQSKHRDNGVREMRQGDIAEVAEPEILLHVQRTSEQRAG